MAAKAEPCADWLSRAAGVSVNSVDILIKNIWHIRGHTASGEPADIVQLIRQTGKVVQIALGLWAIRPALYVKRLHGSTACTKTHILLINLEIMARVLPNQGQGFGCRGNDVFHEVPHKKQPAMRIDLTAPRDSQFFDLLRDIANTDSGQQGERCINHLTALGFRQRAVLAAGYARKGRVWHFIARVLT
ncbi:hypothetical protein RUE5091_04414 [Ruegeria denitrificans]|uniref:Uncharacterized protein n=1 Tax=Ruegeria denitrificans TaxID=1715692 RepID=A0A0P1IKH3_9RHOB|nr:hypothetical protein [Ruegeria denitrificans]CUK19659.1 hypothetical protein RUE5091_04414 [Ruegeria denitrificans]